MKIKVAQLNLPPAIERNVFTLTKDITRVPDIKGQANQPGKLLVSTFYNHKRKGKASQFSACRAKGQSSYK